MAIITNRATLLESGTTTDLAQAGAIFNDATRLADGGLWRTPADSHNQVASLGEYTTDMQAVLNSISAALIAPDTTTSNGQAVMLGAAETAVLTQVQGQLQTLISEAPLSVGHSQAAATAQQVLNTTQTAILGEINANATLHDALAAAAYTAANGDTNVGFQALAAGNDGATVLAAASHGTSLADIGSVFNAANGLALGGINSGNTAQFTADMHAIKSGLTAILNNPAALAAVEAGQSAQDAATTTLHLQTLLNQTDLQLNTFDNNHNTTIAARGTSDNLLDMIDIVQGDPALQAAAHGTNASGMAANGYATVASTLSGSITHYQDNQAETNFWAKFIVGANDINAKLTDVANGTTTAPADLHALISEVQSYQKLGASFSQEQGGVFAARFDNELVNGTLQADSQTAILGLKGIVNGDTGSALAADQAKILAAGAGFIADAQDVSGNNIPLGGGNFIGAATTIASATSVAGVAHGTFPPATGSAAMSASASPGTLSSGAAPASSGLPTDPVAGAPDHLAQIFDHAAYLHHG